MGYIPHSDGLKLLRGFDLNLLTIFEAVYSYQSVSKAADALGMTSPAVSQSIQRLRGHFPDPLFIRVGKGISPTVYADSLHDSIKRSLIDIIDVFGGQNASNRTLSLWSEPCFGLLLLPSLCALFEHCPQVHCQITHSPLPYGEEDITEALLYHRADIIFDTRPRYGAGIEVEKVYSDPIVAVCREAHPRIGQRLTQEMLGREKLVSSNQPSLQTMQQEQLNEKETAFSSYSLMTALAAIEVTDYVGFFPRSLINKLQPAFRVRQVSCAFERKNYEVYMSYSKKALQDDILTASLALIRQRLTSVVREGSASAAW